MKQLSQCSRNCLTIAIFFFQVVFSFFFSEKERKRRKKEREEERKREEKRENTLAEMLEISKSGLRGPIDIL